MLFKSNSNNIIRNIKLFDINQIRIWYGYRYRTRVIIHEVGFPILPNYDRKRVPKRIGRKKPQALSLKPGETFADCRMREAYEAFINLPNIYDEKYNKPYNINALMRSLTKKRIKGMRTFGRIPGIIQGRIKPGELNTKISVCAIEWLDMLRIIKPNNLFNQVFNIHMIGYHDRDTQVICNNFQMNLVTKHPVHIQFTRFYPGKLNRVRVPIHFINSDKNDILKKYDNRELDVYRDELKCFWNGDENIPRAIFVDLEHVKFGDMIRIGDLKLPDGLTLIDPDTSHFEVINIRDKTQKVWQGREEEDTSIW